MAAKRAGVGLGPEEKLADPKANIVADDLPGAPVVDPAEPAPVTEPEAKIVADGLPPPGLLADIAAVLARTAKK